MIVNQFMFGKTDNGEDVEAIEITNANKLEILLINYGASLVYIKTPDINGKIEEITLGYDDIKGYERDSVYFGATIGRCANRIGKGELLIDGEKYQLNCNNGENHLHGGKNSFNKKLWNSEIIKEENETKVIYKYKSEDGEENYPGNLNIVVEYRFTDSNELFINFSAESDKKTPVNLTHHSYFNLSGNAKQNILDHTVMINSHEFTEMNEELIPTGEIKSVYGTDLDFTSPRQAGERIENLREGYDHNYVINKNSDGLNLGAKVYHKESGRAFEIWTTEPGLQFYTGNFLDGSISGRMGKTYFKHYGLCLEPQKFPDAVHHSNFPDVILNPGETYHHQIKFRFCIAECK
ncbi:MAG: galactose mutarotase [Melioribacteraceae bacterium]|nr:galactose mutarotase [Melioribacteraceae bacterium]MCF8395497.1 galactose mutarotase [Melioribacteraceae bacterium]MCF8420837.1 galactose mutarotase [Melioribacteraceae bacterium]